MIATPPTPSRWRLRPAARLLPALLAASSVAATGCYEAKPLRLTVQTPATTLDCARTADAIFFQAAYVRANNANGPDLFYTPRLTETNGRVADDLGWGIGVWLEAQPPTGTRTCGFELEALSPEPGPGMQRPYLPQRGEDFDRTVHEMARRLAAAFGGARGPG